MGLAAGQHTMSTRPKGFSAGAGLGTCTAEVIHGSQASTRDDADLLVKINKQKTQKFIESCPSL